MSTLTMGKQSRFSTGNKRKKRNNTLRRTKRSGGVSGVGRFIVRTILFLLALSLIAVLGVGLLYGYRFMTSTAYFNLDEIHVTGNAKLTQQEVVRNADVQLGLNCLDMNVGEVQSKLESNPWIESATVRREFPGTLRIAIKEKVPCFWMRQGDGLYFADAKGMIIAPMHPGETASLPILSVADDINEAPLVLSGILERIKSGETPFTQAQAAWIKVTSAHEMEIFLDGHDSGRGLTIRLSTDRWDTQLNRLKIVWRDLMRRNEFKDAAIIAASGDKIWIKKRRVQQG